MTVHRKHVNVRSVSTGFSLVEVVLSLGILVLAVTAVLSLYSPSTTRVTNLIDGETAGRLSDNVRLELNRLVRQNGFATLENWTDPGGTTTQPLTLYASRDGSRVLLGNLEANPPADDAINVDTSTGAIPGILDRDRYFKIELVRADQSANPNPDLAYAAGSGFLALRADVVWPYRVPVGTVDPSVVVPGSDGDKSALTAPSQQRTLAFFFILNR